MVVKALFEAGEKSGGCWVAEVGQDRDGPLAWRAGSYEVTMSAG